MNYSIGNRVVCLFICLRGSVLSAQGKQKTHTMRWHRNQLYLLIFIGIISADMTAVAEAPLPSNTLKKFNGFGGELQCMARMPMSQLLRIKKTLQMISNVTVDEMHMDDGDALSARSDTIDRKFLRDKFNNGFAGSTSMGPILTPMPFIGGHFRW